MVGRAVVLVLLGASVAAAFPPPQLQYDGVTEALPYTHLDIQPPLGGTGCVETNDGVVCPVTLDPAGAIDQTADIETDGCVIIGADGNQSQLCYNVGNACIYMDVDQDKSFDAGVDYCVNAAPGIDASDGTTTVTDLATLRLLAGANMTVTCVSVAGPPKRADCTLSSAALVPTAQTYKVDPFGTDSAACGPPNAMCQTIGQAFLNIQANNDNGFATCATYKCVGGTDHGDLCIQASECAGGGTCTGRIGSAVGCGRCFGPGKRCNLVDQYQYLPCTADSDCGSISGSCVTIGGTVCVGGDNAGEACWLPSDCSSGGGVCDKVQPVKTCLAGSGSDTGKVCTSDANCDSGAGTCSAYEGLQCNENADCGTDGLCSAKSCGVDFGTGHVQGDPCGGICASGPDIRKPCLVGSDCRGSSATCSTLTASGGACATCNGGTNDENPCGADSDCGGGTCALGTGGCQHVTENKFWGLDNPACPDTAGALDACTGDAKSYQVDFNAGTYRERLSTEVHFHPGNIALNGPGGLGLIYPANGNLCRGGTEPLSSCAADTDCAGGGTCNAPTIDVSDCFLCRFADFQAWSNGQPIVKSWGGSRFVGFRDVVINTLGDVWPYEWTGKGNLTNTWWGGQMATVAGTSPKCLRVEVHGATCEGGTDPGETCLADAHCAGTGSTCSGLPSGDWGIFGNTFLQPAADGGTGGDACIQIDAVACGNTFNTFIEDVVTQAGSSSTGAAGTAPASMKTLQSSCTLATTTPASAAGAMRVSVRDVQLLQLTNATNPTSLQVGVSTKVIVDGPFHYDACQRDINGSLDYVADETAEYGAGNRSLWAGASGWLGHLNCTSPPDPQNGECWYDAKTDDRFECYQGGAIVPMLPVAGGTSVKVKAADQTNATTTLAADNTLVFTVAASSEYAVSGVLFAHGSGTSVDGKFAFTCPSGATGVFWLRTASEAGNTSDSDDDAYRIACDGTATGRIDLGGNVGSARGVVINGGVVTAGSGGSLTLQWAAQDSGTLTVLKHSSMAVALAD